jgi:hypothetical protein
VKSSGRGRRKLLIAESAEKIRRVRRENLGMAFSAFFFGGLCESRRLKTLSIQISLGEAFDGMQS